MKRRDNICDMADPKRELLRHLVATIDFRSNVSFRDAPESFGNFRLSDDLRTPAEIAGHLGDLMIGSLLLLKGEMRVVDAGDIGWFEAVARFRTALIDLDGFLASDEELAIPIEKLTQGPIADALTHIGQIVMLRRSAGIPVRSEPYFQAEIAAGKA